MAYLALSLKYRPQNFDEVIGQDSVVEKLRQAILKSRLHHAYLFCGPRGVGKTSLARGRCRDYSARKYSDMMSGEAPGSVLREKRSGKEIVRALRKLRGKPVTNMSEVRVLAGEPFT